MFSKVLERIIYNRNLNHYTINNLLFLKKFWFWANHSTHHAISNFVNGIKKLFEKGEYTLGIFVDSSKRFHTVNRDIILTKLHNLGIKGKCLKLLKSYLTNRKQHIYVEQNKNTKFQSTLCGVPQGSNLVPLLFLVYANYLSIDFSLLTPITFAGDTNLFYFQIKIFRNLLIVSKINYRKLPRDLKQLNYGLTYLKGNTCCFIPRTKSTKTSTRC